VPLNKDVWSGWQPGSPQTENVIFADFNSKGPGISNASRAEFSAELTSSQAAEYTMASTLGNDYMNWVDPDYIV
jgi:pectinesterase